MAETNLAENFEQEQTIHSQEVDPLIRSITDVAQEIKDEYTKIQGSLPNPANDNDPNSPKDPNGGNKTEEWLKEWANIGSKISECTRLIHEKGLTPEEQEKRFQATFTLASDYLRYELEIANVFNSLPVLQGHHNLDDDKYSKCRYITDVLGIPYKRAWKISKLTPESVEKAIQYGAEYKEIPTRRLAILMTRVNDIWDLREVREAERLARIEERKAKKKAAEEASIQRGIDDYNAIQNPLPNVAPGDTYNIIYADLTNSKKSISELKTYIIPASENSILFMWSPVNKVKERLDLMESWGFIYKENAIWDRMDSTHTGQYFSNQHDLLLVGIKGEGLPPRSKEKSICRIPLKEGETKPEYYTELVKTMYPGQPWLDVIEKLETEEV